MTSRVRIRGYWPWIAPLFVRLWAIHPLLAWALVFPICKLWLRYEIDGKKC